MREDARPQLPVAIVLLAAIGGAVYLLAPLIRRATGAVGSDAEIELWRAIEELQDRVDHLES